MLPDLSPTHILIVIVVALIVVGPKDLPMLLRKIGQFMGKMRGMANEFRASFDEMARQSELDELRKEVAAMREATTAGLPKDLGLEAAMRSDSESAYMANWAASHAEPTDYLPGAPDTASILPPTTVELDAEAKAAKAAAKPKKSATPKPASAASKTGAQPKAKTVKAAAPAKTSAKKTKSAGDKA
jgi:sec-independent protein translocase protein TatB